MATYANSAPAAQDRATPTRGESDVFEAQLLGGMLRNGRGAVEVVGELREEDFATDPHRRVFRAVASLAGRGEPIDVVTVAQEAARLGLLDDLGGAGAGHAYLAELLGAEPTGVNLAYYARRVREHALLRRLADACREALRGAEQPGAQAEEALDEAERLIFAVGAERLGLTEDERHVRDVVGEVYDRLDERAKAGSGCSGLPTGLGSLDLLTAGLQPSELVVVAARPSVGKTTLGLGLAAHAALEARAPVLFVSLEQPCGELAERLLCIIAGVDGQAVRQGRLTAQERERLAAAGDRLRQAPLVISDLASQRAARIAARARRRAARGELGLLVVDYLQLVEPDNRRDPRHEQVAQVSRRLKLLARELKVPVVVMAQLNREAERRTDRTPRLSDLRESGGIEADADVVLLLHRPDDARPDLHVNVAKNRNGPTGELLLRHDRATGRITDPADDAFSGP